MCCLNGLVAYAFRGYTSTGTAWYKENRHPTETYLYKPCILNRPALCVSMFSPPTPTPIFFTLTNVTETCFLSVGIWFHVDYHDSSVLYSCANSIPKDLSSVKTVRCHLWNALYRLRECCLVYVKGAFEDMAHTYLFVCRLKS